MATQTQVLRIIKKLKTPSPSTNTPQIFSGTPKILQCQLDYLAQLLNRTPEDLETRRKDIEEAYDTLCQ